MCATRTYLVALLTVCLAAAGASAGQFAPGTTAYSGYDQLQTFSSPVVWQSNGGQPTWSYTSTVTAGYIDNAGTYVAAPADTSFKNSSQGPIGTTVNILLSNTETGTPVVQWRGRAQVETAAGAQSPPLPSDWEQLSSDVVYISGLKSAYVVELNSASWLFTDADAATDVYNGVARPARLLPNSALGGQMQWQLATLGDSGVGSLTTAATQHYLGSFEQFKQAHLSADGTFHVDDYLGSWGLDWTPGTTFNVREWAIVDGEGAFAVPEPGTVSLLMAGGLVGLFFGRKRIRQAIGR